MRTLTLAGIAALFLAVTSPVAAQGTGTIPLSHPVVQEMLNDPTSTQGLADLGVIYPSAQGIVVDCTAGNDLLNFMDQLLADALAASEAAGAAVEAALEEGPGSDADLQELIDAWREAQDNLEALLDLLEGPMGLLQNILAAAGC